MHHKPSLLNLTGLSQMKNLWFGSSATWNALSTYLWLCFNLAFVPHASVRNSRECFHVGVFLGRTGSVIEWWGSVRLGTVGGRRGKRTGQQDVAGRLEWRTSSELPERGIMWATVTYKQNVWFSALLKLIKLIVTLISWIQNCSDSVNLKHFFKPILKWSDLPWLLMQSTISHHNNY